MDTENVNMVRQKLAVAAWGATWLTVLCVVPVRAQAQSAMTQAHSAVPWYEQKTMTGDWGGARTSLEDAGIDFHISLLGQAGAVVAGGKREGNDYAQQVTAGADFDLGKLVGDQGGTFRFYVNDRVGRNLSGDFTGSKLEQLGVYGAGENFRLLNASYEQKWFGDRLDTMVGYYSLGNEFGSTPLLCDFLSNGFCAHDQSLPNDSGWLDGPTASWGGRVKYSIDPSLYIETGIFESNPLLVSHSNYGWHLGFQGATGSIVPVEIGKTIKFGNSNLVGHYKIGGYYDDSEVADAEYGSKKMRRGRYGGYILADQMVYAFDSSGKRGVIAFAQATINDKRTALIDSYFTAGVIVQGPFASRPMDNIAFGWVKANVNTRKLNAEYAVLAKAGDTGFALEPAEEDFELDYNFQVTPWLKLTPDVQYSLNPGAFSYKRYQDAWIVAGQFLVSF
jgi:porin